MRINMSKQERKVKKSRLIYGWGINDADYNISESVKDGDRCYLKICPIYKDWGSIVQRGFSDKYKLKKPTYIDVTVCEEWKYFSVFRNWVLNIQPNKDWINCEPDKDLLIEGNKVYSPDTVIYIPRIVNCFINEQKKNRGKYLLGVHWCNTHKKFKAQISNPFTKKRDSLGYHCTELEAHLAWKSRKHELACQLADLQDDNLVSEILRNKYKI